MKNKYTVVGGCCFLLSFMFLMAYFGLPHLRYAPMLWMFIVLFLSLGVTSILSQRFSQRTHAEIGGHLLADALKRTGAINTTIVMGTIACVLFVFGLIFLRWDNTGSEVSVMGTAVFTSLVLGSLGLGLYSLGRALNLRDVDKSRLREILAKTPEKIAWVYERQTTQNSIYDELKGTLSMIDIWIEDGTLFQMVTSAEEKRQFLNLVKQQAPQAHVGYDPKLAQKYPQRKVAHIIIA